MSAKLFPTILIALDVCASLVYLFEGDLRHFVRHIQKGEALKATSVGGEEGGGQRAALHAHSGEDGNGDSQRAPPKAGEVMDGGNTWDQHKISSFRWVLHSAK